MRKFINGVGADVTSTALTYLQSNTQFLQADLYLIGDEHRSDAIWLTDWPSALVWSNKGLFNGTTLKHSQVETKIGLDVTDCEVTWSPQSQSIGNSLITANYYQRALNGYFRNWKVKIWRTLMPTAGDCDTYGAYELFGGHVAETTVTRGEIVFKVNCFLDILNAQVPINVIESTNSAAGFQGATPVLLDNETELPTFQVVTPVSTTSVLGACLSPTANKIYDSNKLQFGFIVFAPGSSLAGFVAAIAQNNSFDPGLGVHYNQFLLYGALPWAPSAGDTFYASTQFPVDQAAAQTAGVYRGFPFVPAPENANGSSAT
jgi:hypothetical protein